MQELEQRANKPSEYKLGHEVDFGGQKALVVRIVDSTSVFQTGFQRYSVTELYVELLTQKGKTEFITLKRRRDDCPEPPGQHIRAPEPLLWKEEDTMQPPTYREA